MIYFGFERFDIVNANAPIYGDQSINLQLNGCQKLMEPSRSFKGSHHFKMVGLRIMNF